VSHRDEFRSALRHAGVKLSNFAIILPEVIDENPAVAEPALDAFKQGVEVAAYLGRRMSG